VPPTVGGVSSNEAPTGPERSAAGAPRPHRPVPRSDLTALIDAAGGVDPSSGADLAATTAAAVLAAGRDHASGAERAPQLVALADVVGLDTLAQLWRDADPVSLPGALWALYVVRHWCRTGSAEVSRLWRAGAPYRPADAVVAGWAADAEEDAVRDMGGEILAGMFRGDAAVALERAAAFFRVVAAGRRDVGEAVVAVDLVGGNEAAADHLAAAARLWRAGALA
jgi:hypothetical protein